MKNLTKKKIVLAVCLVMTSFLLVFMGFYSFFEIVISWVGIVMITIPPYLLVDRYFTEYSLACSVKGISDTNNHNKAKILLLLLIFVFGFIYWLMLIGYMYFLG